MRAHAHTHTHTRARTHARTCTHFGQKQFQETSRGPAFGRHVPGLKIKIRILHTQKSRDGNWGMLPSEKYILYLRVADLATHSI